MALILLLGSGGKGNGDPRHGLEVKRTEEARHVMRSFFCQVLGLRETQRIITQSASERMQGLCVDGRKSQAPREIPGLIASFLLKKKYKNKNPSLFTFHLNV